MNELELVQALRQVVREEIKPLETRLDSMDKRFDGIDTRLNSMDKRFDDIDTRLDSMENSLLKTQMTIEGEISDKLDALADGFAGLIERNAKIDRMDRDIANIKDDVAVIKAVVIEHDENIARLRQAQ